MESKHQKFERMRDARLPKAVKAIELLGNLASRDYERSADEVRALLDQLYDAVEGVADEFGVGEAPAPVDLPDHHPGPVSVSDKAALKQAFMLMKGGEAERGMEAMAKVFLGWSHISEEETA